MAATPPTSKQRAAVAYRWLSQAVTEQPDHVRANVLLVFLAQGEIAVERLIALAASHPRDATAARAVAAAYSVARRSIEEQRSAYLRALEVDGESAVALNNLAWLEVTNGRTQEAFTLARRAVALEPTNPAYLDTWAAVLFARGECQNAVEVQTRAIEVLADGVPPEYRGRFLAALRTYRDSCRRPGSPPR